MTTEKILLIERNPRIIEMLVEAFVRRFNAHITCVSSGADALDVEILEPHSIAVVDTQIDDMDVITLTERLCEFSDRPVILMGDAPTAADVIESMRHGVVDFFTKPFEIEAMLDRMQDLMRFHRGELGRRHRYEKSRRLLRKVIRERRELNQRVDLICKDLVSAHKRLATRVLTGAAEDKV